MDFQSSQYPSSFAGFSTSAAHLGQTSTHSPQTQFFNSDPQARFAQSNNAFSYGGLPNGGQGASFPNSMQSGAMMQPGAAMSQSQLHQARGMSAGNAQYVMTSGRPVTATGGTRLLFVTLCRSRALP